MPWPGSTALDKTCMFSLPNLSRITLVWTVQAGEVAPAFGGAIPSASAPSTTPSADSAESSPSSADSTESSPSSTDSAPSAPSSTDSPGGENDGGPDEDTSEDREAMDVSEAPDATLSNVPVTKSGRRVRPPIIGGPIHDGNRYGDDTERLSKLVRVDHETQGPTHVDPSTQKNYKAGDRGKSGSRGGGRGGGRGAKRKAGGGGGRGGGRGRGGKGKTGGGTCRNSGGKRKSDEGGGGGDGNDDDGAAPMDVSDDGSGDVGGDFGGGDSSDEDVVDGYGSAAGNSSSTGPTASESSPTNHTSSVTSSPDTSEQQEDLDDERDARPCLVCGKNDDIPNTLLCARPIGRKEDVRFCDKACHVRCTDLEDVPEGDVSEYTVET